MTPPGRCDRSRTTNDTPRCCSSNAAASPAIPPPTMMTSTGILVHGSHPEEYKRISSVRSPRDQILEKRDKCRRGVQRLGSPERRAGIVRHGSSLDIDIEQDLGVI